jgi:hypothetical protein
MFHTGAEGGSFNTLEHFDNPLRQRYGDVNGI